MLVKKKEDFNICLSDWHTAVTNGYRVDKHYCTMHSPA